MLKQCIYCSNSIPLMPLCLKFKMAVSFHHHPSALAIFLIWLSKSLIFMFVFIFISHSRLPPAPVRRSTAPEYNVMSIAEKSVSKMKQPTSSTRAVSSTDDESRQSVTKTAAPKSGTAVHVAHSQSDPVLPRRDDGALITNIAEDSVRFLLSGIV